MTPEELLLEEFRLAEGTKNESEAAGESMTPELAADAIGSAIHASKPAESTKLKDTSPPADPDPVQPAAPQTTSTGQDIVNILEGFEEAGPIGALLKGIGILDTPAPVESFVKYAMPDSIAYQGSTDDDPDDPQQFGDGWDQIGQPRVATLAPSIAGSAINTAAAPDTSSGATPAQDNATTPTQPGAPATGNSANPNDSSSALPGDPQWFLDHSQDIASAVRSAMLNLSSLNDTISGL